MRGKPLRSVLTLLRERTGLSNGGYTRLVARVHEDLGFGHTAARREKFARWESGRIRPEITAQLAIAEIHGVPHDEVLRRGWPDWMLLASGHAAPLDAPWTPAETQRALAGTPHIEPAGVEQLPLTADSHVATLTTRWFDALNDVLPLPHMPGTLLSGETVGALQRLHAQTLQLKDALGPRAALPLARADLRTIGILSREARNDARTGARLFTVAANAACLTGWMAPNSATTPPRRPAT